MKKISILFICLIAFQYSKAQERVITTGVPFLLVAADARSAGMADQGVATAPDAFSQQWNPAKYAFISKQQGFSTSYTPYLTSLVNDISLGQITYYNRINERSAFAGSLRYFGLGEIELRQQAEDAANIVKPNELALDGSYTLQLSEKFSMGVSGRYIRSNLKIPDSNNDAKAASTFAVDVCGFFQGEETAYNDFNGRLRLGFNFQNLGPKINYDKSVADLQSSNFLPANMKLGAGYDFAFDEYNKFSLSVEFAKLLVPTPFATVLPIYVDTDGNGTIDLTEKTLADTIAATANSQNIQEYKAIGWSSGIFKAFGQKPGGFSELIKEFTYSVGAEYSYQDSFAFRLGYFHESPDKGARKFFSLGAGFKYNVVKVDVSYLFNASNVKSPLENTLRFSLTFGFGDDYSNY
jgi:Type IX secretion system protein PorV